MINKRAIIESATRRNLNPHIVEKDYVLDWVLAGIYAHDKIAKDWLFKGGTCLNKCFFETYRFSEDLDFTLLDPNSLSQGFLRNVFKEIGEWVYEQSGIEVPTDQQDFEIYRNPRGNLSCQGKLSYCGPISPRSGGLPRIKLDLTADECVLLPPVQVAIFHPYSDMPKKGIEVLAYDYIEAFAEKFRALSERARPRDLYDVVSLFRNSEARPDRAKFLEVLSAKCEFKEIDIPRLADMYRHKVNLEAGWKDMLAHQLPALLPFESFWNALGEVFAWLERAAEPSQPAALPIGGTDEIVRERSLIFQVGTLGQSHVETLRFAAANRLVVNLDYRDQQGHRSTRAIEAYSLRRSQVGEILLMAIWADDGQPRSYRLDCILGIEVTQRTFLPRYLIELC